MRIAAGIEYDGTQFNGWQIQPEGRTVQQELEHALSAVAAADIATVCAGRTDAGVHAVGQVVHFDTPVKRSSRSWVLGTNSGLPPDVCMRWAQPVADDFHARFSAVWRSYRYIILNRGVRSALLRDRVCFEPRQLDATVMHDAGRHLLGEHDFSAFRATSCQASNARRTIRSLTVRRREDFVVIDVTANAFLQNMVRILAGVLTRVGRGEERADWVADILAAGDRRHLGVTMPAAGLYLVAVEFSEPFGIPVQPVDAVAVLPLFAGV